MTDILEIIVLTSLFIFGIHYATLYTPNYKPISIQPYKPETIEVIPNDREILWFLRYYGQKHLPKWAFKPFLGCITCMSSFWGTLFYWGFVLNGYDNINSLTFVLWGAVVTAVAGLNRLLRQIAQI